MGFLGSLFNVKRQEDVVLSKEDIAKLLKTDRHALEAFEDTYRKEVLNEKALNLFEMNAKQAADANKGNAKNTSMTGNVSNIIQRIVEELVSETISYTYDGTKADTIKYIADSGMDYVKLEDIRNIKRELQPQLTGTMMYRHINEDAYPMLLTQYYEYKTSKNRNIRQRNYNMFRQGLDILDLDSVMYEILGTNVNSMGKWLPQMVEAVKKQSFFRIPATTIIKVPLTLLQMTRLDYEMLTPTTLAIADEYCKKVFHLNTKEEYFIKTGTYSSKFDFRNAYVHGEKEVNELGEYLLFIQNQASCMASPLNKPVIYGVSTTNEWVVREFIHDKENNPSIYKGLPLHTEYRVFVDFDDDTVLGVSPYWHPDVMKHRFGGMDDKDSPHNKHDWVIYSAHEKTLMDRYYKNVGQVVSGIKKILPDVQLNGQWSVDIMQNGDDFWIIDMATAFTSALKECVPPHMLKKTEEDWMPKLP